MDSKGANHSLAVAACPDLDFDVVITGVGDDEFTMRNTFQREDWELPGSVCPSSLVTANARADMFVRRGIWPICPLMSRPVIDLCRSLPQSLRRDRMLNLLTLARAGLSDGFIYLRYIEHFGNAMRREALLFDYAALNDSFSPTIR